MKTITDQRLRSRLTQRRNSWHDGAVIPAPTPDDLAYARILLSDPCSYCGGPAGRIDHITHTEHGWTNLTATCQACNTAKGQHTLIAFTVARHIRQEIAKAKQDIRNLGESHGTRTPLQARA